MAGDGGGGEGQVNLGMGLYGPVGMKVYTTRKGVCNVRSRNAQNRVE